MSVQASRGRDLEERNRVLERELAALRGDVIPPSSASSTSSSSPSSVILSTSSLRTSVSELNGGCGDSADDLEMEDGVGSKTRDCSREEGVGELRGRRLGRTRDKTHMHALGLGPAEEGMEI